MTRPEPSQFSIRCEECASSGDWHIYVNNQFACTQPTEQACDEWCDRFGNDPELQERFHLDET